MYGLALLIQTDGLGEGLYAPHDVEKILWCATLFDGSAELDQLWTWWWLHCLWLSCSLSSCCHGSTTWSLLKLFTRPKEGRRLMAVKPVGTLVVERILFRNLCPPIKTKLSDKVASCSFTAPFSFYFVTFRHNLLK